MRFTKPDAPINLPYSVVKVDGCVNTAIGFTLLKEEAEVNKRRYCNKILVHECIEAVLPDPIELDSVELLATSDPCYKTFEIYKTSPADITLEKDVEDKVTHISVAFTPEDTVCAPLKLAYRLYGYIDGGRILLSQGTLNTAPCTVDVTPVPYWTDLAW